MGGHLAGRVALVTGAERNIGAEVAIRLAAEGASVAVNYRGVETQASAEAVVVCILTAGGRARAVRGDVGREDEVAAMVEEVTNTFGPPDILINNAATSVAAQSPWHQLSAASWDEVLRVNVTGAFLCARALYPAMAAANRGDIISMSSITARLGRTGNLHYVTSKAALVGFTRALAREAGEKNIRVNALMIGAIRTSDEAVYGSAEEVDQLVLGAQALKRRGLPRDVAGAVTFLLSDDASFITGHCLTIDGGWTMS